MIESLEPAVLAEFAVWFVVFLFSLTLHEGAHALLARLGGDDTAYLGGQVSLSPLPHIRREPVGTIIVPIVSFFLVGWMMGWASTPVDPHWSDRHPRRAAAMAAAGPCANLALGLAAFIALRVMFRAGVFVPPATGFDFTRMVVPAPGTPDGSLLWPLATTLSIALSLNMLLFLFNLLPLPPMDGSAIAEGLFPETLGRLVRTMRATPMMGLIGLLAAWHLIPYIMVPAFRFVVRMLFLPI